jgi:hypothetical protein
MGQYLIIVTLVVLECVLLDTREFCVLETRDQ